MSRIVIVGGGYAGFYAALGLERKLVKSDQAEVILIDPRPYMTYQPFLPEVLAGSIEPRHALVSLRKNLPRTRSHFGFRGGAISTTTDKSSTRTGAPLCGRCTYVFL